MKRARLLLALPAVVVLAFFCLPLLISAERFRPLIQDRFQVALGRPVAVGAISLHLFPLSLHATNLAASGLATVEALDVNVRLFPLLQGKLAVESLVLTRPVVDYQATPDSSNSNGAPPEFGFVKIIDGRLRADGNEYANIDADLRGAGAQISGTVSWENGTLPVKLAFSTTAAGGVWQVSKLDAAMGQVTAAFTGTIDGNAGTINGSLLIKPSPLAGLPMKSAYKPTGTITADVKVNGPFKTPSLNGAVRIANLEVTGGQLSQSLRATELALDLTPAQIIAKPFSLQVGPTLVQAAFQLTGYKTIDATVTTTDAAIQDLLALAPVAGVSGTGKISLRVRATGLLSNPQFTGSGAITAADLRLPGFQPNLMVDTAQIKFEADTASVESAVFHTGKTNWRGGLSIRNLKQPQISVSLNADQLSNTEIQAWFPPSKPDGSPIAVNGDIAVARMQINDLVLQDMKAGLAFRDKTLTLAPLTASLYGGQLTGSAAVNLKVQPAVFDLKTHLEKIEAGQLLAATTPLRGVVTGPLTAEADLQFSPKPGEDFARTLGGTIQFQLAQGKLLPLNLLGEMSALGRFLKPMNRSGTNTPFLGMKGQFKINNGAAETQDLRLELDRAAALITGSLNLADQTLNLRMLTTLNKQFSDEVGGSKIGAFLSAAMSSPKGELLMPSLIRGTFSKPVLGPDAVTLGKMKLSQPQDFQQGVQGVMDIFKGKKKQP